MTKTSRTFKYHGQCIDGSTLILPSPNGIGYMGQLCVDLLIQNLGMKRTGFIDCSFVSGFVGNNSFTGNLNEITTAFEGKNALVLNAFILVFSFNNSKDKYILLQLRSKVIEVVKKIVRLLNVENISNVCKRSCRVDTLSVVQQGSSADWTRLCISL